MKLCHLCEYYFIQLSMYDNLTSINIIDIIMYSKMKLINMSRNEIIYIIMDNYYLKLILYNLLGTNASNN